LSPPPGERRERAARRWLPLAWGVCAAALLAATAQGPGISDAEAAALAGTGPSDPAASAAAVSTPPSTAAVLGAAGAVATRLGAPRLAGYRAVSALAGGALAALVAMLALALAEPGAALLAPAILLCAPRLLASLVEAGPLAPGAALAVGTVLAYRTAAAAGRARARLAAALVAGCLFAVALALRAEAVQLLAVVAAHVLGCAALRALQPERARLAGPRPRSSPPSLAAMLVLGPIGALALWPQLWAAPLPRIAGVLAASLGTRPAWGFPLYVTGLALPVALVAAFAAGALHGAARCARAVRGGPGLSDELLLLFAAVGPLAAAQAGLGSREPGPGPWVSAFPFLAILAARALHAAARAIWPARASLVAGFLAALVLAPGVVATARSYPLLSAAWGELAGGAPGAATLGLPRQDGGVVASLLREIAVHARPGARVYWAAVPAEALRVYTQDGRIRPDLAVASRPEEADLAVVPLPGDSRQEEYRVWAAFRSSTPVAGTFLDEVPLAWVYAQPGAWR